MKSKLYCKILAVGIIVLLMGVSVSSGFTVNSNPSIKVNQRGKCSECNKISDSDLIRLERLLNRGEVYSKLLLVLSRYNPEIKEKCEELLDVINSDRPWDFPIICIILESTWNQLLDLGKIISDIITKSKDNPIFNGIIYFFFMLVWLPITLFVLTLGVSLGCDYFFNSDSNILIK
jgi:hypothetical protein